jgi:putative heme degradation protein
VQNPNLQVYPAACNDLNSGNYLIVPMASRAIFREYRQDAMEDKSMDKLKEEMQELAADLRQSRDELRVEMALAKAEIRDDWEELEKQWQRFSQQLKHAGHEAADAGEDVGGALSLLGQELKNGYARIRKAL